MSTGLLQRAVGWIGGYLSWVKDTLASDTARAEVLADLGIPADSPAPLVIEDSQLSSIDAYGKQADPDQDAFLSTWGDIMTVSEAIRGFLEASGGASDELLRQFFTLTGTEYVRLRYPTLFFWLRLLAVIEDRAPDAFYGDAGASPDVFTRVYDLLSDGYDVLGSAYGTPEDDAGAARLAAATFVPLGALLGFWDHTARKGLDLVGGGFGLPATTVLQGWDTFEGSPTPIADHLSSSVLSFSFGGLDIGTAVQGSLGATLAWVPRDAGGPGLFAALNGSANLRLRLGSVWKLDTKKSFPDIVDVLIWDSIDVNPGDAPVPTPDPAQAPPILRTAGPPPDPGDPNATAAATAALLDAPLVTGEVVRFTLAPVPATPQQPYVLGGATGTRLEIGSLALTVVIAETGVDVRAIATSCALVVQRGDGSGFVQKILPASGVRLSFDLGLGLAFTPSAHFHLEGGSGLQVTLPLDRALGPLRLQQLVLDLAAGSKVPAGGLRFEASIAASITLGRFTASVDRLGFEVTAGTDDGAPPAIGFKEPNGIGLLLDASVVTGGGYLFHDPAKDEYAGVLQLELKGLTLQAIGLITELPGGDYSLLVIIEAANFPGVALPFGFRLTGVGGLIGLNRTVNVEALRAGLKQRSLDLVLFPENPVRDAPRIVSALGTIMPPLPEQTVVGLMARITWGVPTILTIDLGLIYEGPAPSRLLVLGQFKVVLPAEDKPLVTLKMDALGVVDFGTGEVSIDAVLYDSKITRFPITGDMALRARFGGDSTFAVAVGGLHPKFSPPAGFPELKRVTIGLGSSESSKLTLTAYLALTSNTAQLGARLDFVFKAAGFSVEGHLGFDALFTFSPFSFVVDLRAGVTLKWHGRTLLGVTLELTLSGPSPWRAAGKAKFEIWWFSKTVSFDRTFGGEAPPAELPPADPGPILLAALADPRNWSDQLAGAAATLATLREVPVDAGTVRLHPLGALSVRQRVVPLGIDISRFGSGAVQGERRFDVAALAPDGSLAPGASPVLDEFAPGQFLDLSDDERLARPSFERMGAGVRVAVGGVAWGGQADAALIGDADLTYETVVVGVPEPPPRQVTVFVPDLDELRLAATFGAVGRSVGRRAGAARFRGEQQVADVPHPAYAVVGTGDLEPVAMPGMAATAPSYTAARQALARHLATHPEQAGSLQVVEVEP